VTVTAEGLRKLKFDEPISYQKAIAIGYQKYGKGKPGPGRGHKTGTNSTCFIRGENPTYLTARLARDRPDILKRAATGALWISNRITTQRYPA